MSFVHSKSNVKGMCKDCYNWRISTKSKNNAIGECAWHRRVLEYIYERNSLPISLEVLTLAEDTCDHYCPFGSTLEVAEASSEAL